MYLIAHRESPVVSCGSPQVCNVGEVDKVDEVQPSVENEPSRFPVIRDEVRIISSREREGVEEEEAKDHDDATQDAPPQFLVHQGLDALLSIQQIFHGEIQGVERPDVKSSQCSCEWQNDKQDYQPCILRGDGEASNSINNPKNKMSHGQDANVYHQFPESRFDYPVTHADDKQEEKREGIAPSIEDCDYNHHGLCQGIISMGV